MLTVFPKLFDPPLEYYEKNSVVPRPNVILNFDTPSSNRIAEVILDV